MKQFWKGIIGEDSEARSVGMYSPEKFGDTENWVYRKCSSALETLEQNQSLAQDLSWNLGG